MLALLAILAVLGTGAAALALASSGAPQPMGGVRTAQNGVLAADPALAAALVEGAENYAAVLLPGTATPTIAIMARGPSTPTTTESARAWMLAQGHAGQSVLMSVDGREPGEAIAVQPGREAEWSHVSRGGPFAVVISQEPIPGQPAAPIPGQPAAPIPGQPAAPIPGAPNPPAPPGAPPAPPVDPFAGLPAELAAKAAQLAATGSPPALAALGKRLAQSGYAAAAAAAERMAAEREAFYDLSGGVQYIRPGDIASRWAQHYTGSFARWEELCAPDVNPAMSVQGSGQTATPAPWKVGQRVYLPRSWEWHRGAPPAPAPAGKVSAKVAKPAPAAPPPVVRPPTRKAPSPGGIA